MYACTSKLMQMHIPKDQCFCADSSSELDIRNISNINISGSFTILSIHGYRSTSQCSEPITYSEMQSGFGDSNNIWVKTGGGPSMDMRSGGYHCQYAFICRH
jgi:hypothetical protein